jgi:hypothetical protein
MKIMSETKDSVEQILELLKQRGYRGFANGHFYISGQSKTTTVKKVMALLDKDDIEDPILRLSWIEDVVEIERAIRNKKLSLSEGNIDISKLPYRIYKTLSPGEYDKNTRTGVRFILYNSLTDRMIPSHLVDIDAVFEKLGTNRKEAIASSDIPWAVPKFDPYDFTREKKEIDEKGEVALVGEEYTLFNLYNPPEWVKYDKAPKYHGFIKELFEYVFPVEESRELVLDWFHYCVFNRNETVLVLVGARGIGKTTIIDGIATGLIGEEYSELANQGIFDDKFNGAFLNKRLVVFDETPMITKEDVNKIKQWINSRIPVEKKGVDTFTTKNFSSIAMLSNNLDQMRYKDQDRRFSVPDITNKPMVEGSKLQMAIARFKKMQDERTDEYYEMISEFGHWLKKRKPKHSNQIPIKSEYYYYVAGVNRDPRIKEIIEYLILNGQAGVPLDPTDVFAALEGRQKGRYDRSLSRDRIDSLLVDERYRGLTIATVTDTPDGFYCQKSWVIIPTKEFIEKYGKYTPPKSDEEIIREIKAKHGMAEQKGEDLL